jgi:hypothetical protein
MLFNRASLNESGAETATAASPPLPRGPLVAKPLLDTAAVLTLAAAGTVVRMGRAQRSGKWV